MLLFRPSWKVAWTHQSSTAHVSSLCAPADDVTVQRYYHCTFWMAFQAFSDIYLRSRLGEAHTCGQCIQHERPCWCRKRRFNVIHSISLRRISCDVSCCALARSGTRTRVQCRESIKGNCVKVCRSGHQHAIAAELFRLPNFSTVQHGDDQLRCTGAPLQANTPIVFYQMSGPCSERMPAGRSPRLSPLKALISAGSKDLSSKWGRKGLLRVKIYDFALYVNPRHVSASVTSHRRQDRSGAPHAHPQPRCSCNDTTSDTEQRSRRFSFALRRPALADHHHPQSTHACICSPPTRRQHQQPVVQSTALTDRVRAATPQVEMSVCVRTARDLPLLMLRAEYTRILRRRMNAVGGSPDDAALRALLSYFRASALPQAATRRGCVRRGTVMQFSRARSGHLCATANGAPVATVHSPKLCEAVFDLYLGDAPVCGEAKAQAHVALEHMLGTHDAPSAPTFTPRLPSRRP